MHRWLRVLTCLLLVCCILVNLSPIRGNALSAVTSAVVGSVAAAPVVAGVFTALGVMPDSANTSVFETLVNECTSALTSSGVFIDGLVTVLQLTSGGSVKNHVNQGIVESILDWLFQSETVNVAKNVATAGMMFYGEHSFPEFPTYEGYPYVILLATDAGHPCNYYLRYSTAPIYSESGTSTGTWFLPGVAYSRLDINFSSYDILNWNMSSSYDEPSSVSGSKYSYVASSSIYVWSNHDIYSYKDGVSLVHAGSDPTSTLVDTTIATGLVAGQIGTEIETDYETWVQEGVVAVDFGIGYVDDPNTNNDDDDDDDGDTEIGPTVPVDPSVPDSPSLPGSPVSPTPNPSPWWKNNKWLNVGGGIIGWELADLITSLLNQTQTDIQTGVGDPQHTVDTSLFGNNGTGNNDVIDSDTPGSDPSTPTDPSAPTDISAYTFDLREIFPFCIPFDIYDFLNCLDAAPEAPVINWKLYLPDGSTYPLVIDLSYFDGVAQILRQLELLLFCVGLASKTRDLIKG